LSIYLDVSVIVALFAVDPLNSRAEHALRRAGDKLVVSSFAAAEFSSVIARRVRMRDLRHSEARTAFSNFDTWCRRDTEFMRTESIDISVATRMIRRLDLSVRTPDALHLAMVQRASCKLLTFDNSMARVARALGMAVITT
jgi:predicted nucleic acid-binding protein